MPFSPSSRSSTFWAREIFSSGLAFEPLPEDPDERAEVVRLRDELQDQLDRGATHAFSPSFLLGALLGLLALLPIGLARRVDL